VDKDRFDQFEDVSNQNLSKKAEKEILEISSTGYGLESVSTEREKERESLTNKKTDSFSEGY
jgi:hypothetical protein